MHKIMIVDDDRIIRQGLVKTIPWLEHGFEVVGEAGDGEQALKIIQSKQPQIVVSDIRMPFMDGLELARQTKEYNSAIKFIFLTGFEDFSYAKAAIDLKAIDYLLKPVERDVLLEKVKQAAAVYDKEQGNAIQLKEAKPYLRTKLFRKILAGQENDDVYVREGAHLGLDLDYAYSVCMLMRIDDYDKEEIHPKAGHDNLKQELVNTINAIIADNGTIGATVILEHDAMAMFLLGDDEASLGKQALVIAQNVCEQVRSFLQTTLTIGLGTVQTGLKGMAASFDDANAVLAFRHVIGKNTVITINDIDALVNEVQQNTVQSEEDLVEKVRLGLVDDALQLLSGLESCLCSSRLTLEEIRMRAVDMLLGLFKGAAKWAPEWCKQHKIKKTQYYNAINNMQTVTEIMELMRSLVDSLAQFMTEENSNQRSDVIDEVTAYIEEHYAEHGLSLQDIGQYVHMNPIYLSVLFKKKKKITFTGFLLQIRMTKAMEMLRATDLKTYEVAEKTGYSSPEYFGACFKKYTGSSPLEFRNRS